MALSDPRAIFGVHSVSPYNRTTGEFYGILKVLGGSSISLSGETINLMGGSSKYPWASEDGPIEAEMSLKVKEYPDFLFELFLGKAPTANAAEASGNASAITNKKGTSVMNATTGVTSVLTVGTAADLKFGKYLLKYASATTLDVYFSSDADIARGTNGTYQSDLLKVTATPLTITSGAPTVIPNFGLSLNGGSGAIAFTSGDTAQFEVRPANTKSMTVTVGASADSLFPEFGAIIMSQKRGNQELFEIDALRCKGIGLPMGFEENAWSEAEIKAKLLYDSTADAVFKVRAVTPSGT